MGSIFLRISRFAFDLSNIIYRTFRASLKWGIVAWRQAWSDIFAILRSLVRVSFSKQTWIILIVVMLVAMVVFGPSSMGRFLPELTGWRLEDFAVNELKIYVNYPEYISSEDEGYFEISVHNMSDQILNEVYISIRSNQGLLVFDETNLVTIDTLQEGEMKVNILPFHLVRYQAGLDEMVMLKGSFVDEDKIIKWSFSNQPLILKNSVLRKQMVRLRKLPETVDLLAKYLGYIGSLVAGILLFSGKIQPVASQIFSWLKSKS